MPGVGPATVKALAEVQIFTTFQLMGKYLNLKEKDVGPVELADRYYFWLKATKTAAGSRAGVVRCIAEKMNLQFPGIYQADAYECEELG